MPYILQYQVGTSVSSYDGEADVKSIMNEILLKAISGEEKKTVY